MEEHDFPGFVCAGAGSDGPVGRRYGVKPGTYPIELRLMGRKVNPARG